MISAPRWIALSCMGVLAGCGLFERTGSLHIDVSAPPDVTPALEVSGPDGFNRLLSQTTTIEQLTPGAYSVLATPVATPMPLADVIFDGVVSGSPANLTAGQTANAAVTYAMRIGSGLAWIPTDRGGDVLIAFAAELDGGAFLHPDLSLVSLDGGRLQALAFDRLGNLWATNDQGYVLRLPPGTLDGGALLGTQQIVSTQMSAPFDAGLPPFFETLDAPIALAFDTSGALYVSNCGAVPAIHRFATSDLARGGELTPDLTLVAASIDAGAAGEFPSIDCIYSLAFDRAGALWFANFQESTVHRVPNPSALSGLQHANPDVTLLPRADVALDGGTTRSLAGPNGLAFNSSGELWIANWANASIATFVVPTDAGIFALAPVAQLESGLYVQSDAGVTPLFSKVSGVFFDNAGALWAASSGSHTLTRFVGLGSLQGHVFAMPERVIETPSLSVNGGNFGFDPPPANVPLYR